jgi:hypothetical protein
MFTSNVILRKESVLTLIEALSEASEKSRLFITISEESENDGTIRIKVGDEIVDTYNWKDY